METLWVAEDVLTVQGFMSPDECRAHIDDGEGRGFEEATISTGLGMVMRKDLRNNDRVIVDDPTLATALWGRVRSFLPSAFKAWVPVGVNERFRFYRYDVGQQFDWHQDGFFERDNGERSHFTFMVYLNDGFEGGETSFSRSPHVATTRDPIKVEPKTGMAPLFHHPIPHKGEPVRSGRKYVLRTDVMFAREAMTPPR